MRGQVDAGAVLLEQDLVRVEIDLHRDHIAVSEPRRRSAPVARAVRVVKVTGSVQSVSVYADPRGLVDFIGTNDTDHVISTSPIGAEGALLNAYDRAIDYSDLFGQLVLLPQQ